MRRIIRIGVTALMLALALAARDGSSETMTHDGAGATSQITLRAGERDVVVTLADAREMRAALQGYLDADKKRSQQTLPADLPPPDAPFIDEDGVLRLGPWLLQPEGDKLVLMQGFPPRGDQQLLFDYIAHLSKVDNRWTVTAVSLRKTWLRRPP